MQDATPGDIIPRRIRTKDGNVRVIDMEVPRHKVKRDTELKAELAQANFTDIRVLEEDRFTFGNSAILVCRRP